MPGRLLLLAALLFHPIPTQLFCHVNSENLYTCSFIVLVVSLAMGMTHRNRRGMFRCGLLAGFSGAIAGISRQETVLVYVLIVLSGVLIVKAWVLQRVPRRLVFRRLALAFALPLAMAIVAEQAVRARNQARIGMHAMYDWSLPGLASLYQAMLSVPPESPRLRVPMPLDVRERVASASPLYASLLELMNTHPRCEPYRRVGETTTGVPGEPGSYNLWLMREAAWLLHDDRFADAREANDFYAAVASEIRAAQDRGALPRRWAPLSFVPPEWGQLPLEVTRSIGACWTSLTRIGFSRVEPGEVAEDDLLRFDAVALRRSALLRPDPAPGVYWHRPRVVQRLDRVKLAIAGALPIATAACLVIAALGGVAARFARAPVSHSWYALSALLWAAFVLRLLLVATLDATGVLASTRYMMPSAVVLVPLTVLGLHALRQLALKRRAQPSSPVAML